MRKIPVWKTIADGYSFTFGHLGTIIGLIWLPMVIVSLAGYFAMSQYYGTMPSAMEAGDSGAIGRSVLVVLLWSVASLVLSSMMYAAVTRQALGLRHGPALVNFQFGAGELRVLGAILAFAGIVVVFMLIYMLVLGTAAGLARVLPAPAQGAVAIAIGLSAIVILFALVYAMVRLSFLLIPATVAEEKIGLAQSWQMTGGNFWRIFLIGLATLGPLIVLMAGAEIAILGPAFFMPHPVQAGDADAQMRALIEQMRAASPHMPLLYGFSFLIAPLLMGLGLSPPAFAYLALKNATTTS